MKLLTSASLLLCTAVDVSVRLPDGRATRYVHKKSIEYFIAQPSCLSPATDEFQCDRCFKSWICHPEFEACHLAAEVYAPMGGIDQVDYTRRSGRYTSDFIWNTRWKDQVGLLVPPTACYTCNRSSLQRWAVIRQLVSPSAGVHMDCTMSGPGLCSLTWRSQEGRLERRPRMRCPL